MEKPGRDKTSTKQRRAPSAAKRTRRTAKDADGLQNLLGPSAFARFAKSSFGRQYAHFRGEARRFEGLYSLADFERDVTGSFDPNDGRLPLRVKAIYGETDYQGGFQNVSPAHLVYLFDAGMTICVDSLELNNPRVAALARATCQQLDFRGRTVVNAYYSPHGRGFGWHFDSQHVLVMQIDGSKRWQFGEAPGVALPPFNLVWQSIEPEARERLRNTFGLRPRPPRASERVEKELRPGDILYLPPGTWHRAFAEGRSFALTLTLFPVTAWSVLSTYVSAMAVQGAAAGVGTELVAGQEPEQLAAAIRRLADAVGKMTPEALLQTFDAARNDPVIGTLVQQAGRYHLGEER